MPTTPIVDSHFSGRMQLVAHYAVPLEEGKLQIRHAIQSAVLSGQMVTRIFPRLFPLLDGTRTLEQIESQMEGLLTREQLLRIALFLKSKDLLREVEPPPPELAAEAYANESAARYFSRHGSRYSALLALKRACIGIINDGPVVPGLVAELAHLGVPRISIFGSAKIDSLEMQQTHHYRAGAECSAQSRQDFLRHEILRGNKRTDIRVIEQPGNKTEDWEALIRDLDMLVVTLQGPILFHPWLEHVNAAALALGIPWTSVALLDGEAVHIGPTIRPGVTACYKCFELRLKSNLVFYEENERFEQHIHKRGTASTSGSCLRWRRSSRA